jgi:hypothetical protein
MTTSTPTPSPASAPGAGPSAEEKKAATGAVALGLALGGPVGGVIMALAIGIEQAFGKSGWDQPSWLGGDKPPALTPEEVQQRHDEAVRRAQEYIANARDLAEVRNAEAKKHHQDMKEWLENGKKGPKPERPPGRGPGEYLGNFFNASKSWYTLFDDRMTKGNEKITGTYPAIADFFRGLWNFITGFAEGAKTGWQGYWDEKNKQDEQHTPDDEPTPTPQPEIDPPTQAEIDPPAEADQIDPAPPVTPEPETEPTELPAGEPATPLPSPPPVTEPVPVGGSNQGELNSGPNGPGEGTVEGEPMTTDQTAALPSGGGAAVPHMGAQGETNLDLLHQAFAPAAPVLKSVSEQVDTLKPQSLAVASRVARIAALCAVAGAPTAVFQMMEQARLLTGAVDAGLGDIDLHNEVARELTDEALIGLLPAQDDLNTTRAEQASGDLYNRAGH